MQAFSVPWLIALCFCFVMATALILFQRRIINRRVDSHLRSFGSMFAHATRSHLAGLKLFIAGLEAGRPADQEMLIAARKTIDEVVAINEGLFNFAHPERADKATKRAPLGALLDTITQQHAGYIRLEVDPSALAIPVPEAQFFLILKELVLNAIQAAPPGKDPLIIIRGAVEEGLFQRRQLKLKLIDNGVGMDPATLKKALMPTFSSKGGNHVGLGLNGCIDLLKLMRGKLVLKSDFGTGTEIEIVYPL